MKIILAFDSFKGCLSARDVCLCASHAIKEFFLNISVVEFPLSDGGEGLLDCLQFSQSISSKSNSNNNLDLHKVTIKVHDPLMKLIDASYLISSDGDFAFMEMAASSGLNLVPKENRNPMLTTTYGVGDMFLDAKERGCKKIFIGLGGSATCDGGMGMVKCLREHGYSFQTSRLPLVQIISDVNNPLYGNDGAAYVFAPQKGATEEQVEILDQQLRRFARETERLGLADNTLAECPGAGAAGGLGYALMAYLHADIKPGIEEVLSMLHFDSFISDTDLVITGEGQSDEQTLMGKVPFGVLKHCKKHNVPVWLLSGSIDDPNKTLNSHFDLVRSINEGDTRPFDILLNPFVAKENMSKMIVQLLRNYNL